VYIVHIVHIVHIGCDLAQSLQSLFDPKYNWI
jgi:hypothetical protein